jgi:hypothetical protein
MELHALDHQAAVPHAHDLVLVGRRGDEQFGGQRAGLRDQGVVTPDLAGLRQAGEQPEPVEVHERGLAVHQATRAHHLATEDLDDGLMPEAHAEDRYAAGKRPDHVHRHAGVVGSARAG